MAFLTDEESSSARPLVADRECLFAWRRGEHEIEVGAIGFARARMMFVPLPAHYKVTRKGEAWTPKAGRCFYVSLVSFNGFRMMFEAPVAKPADPVPTTPAAVSS